MSGHASLIGKLHQMNGAHALRIGSIGKYICDEYSPSDGSPHLAIL
jgi:hypothetical protein